MTGGGLGVATDAPHRQILFVTVQLQYYVRRTYHTSVLVHNITPCTTGGTISIFLVKGGGLSKVFATDYSFSRKVRLRARIPIEHIATGD